MYLAKTVRLEFMAYSWAEYVRRFQISANILVLYDKKVVFTFTFIVQQC